MTIQMQILESQVNEKNLRKNVSQKIVFEKILLSAYDSKWFDVIRIVDTKLIKVEETFIKKTEKKDYKTKWKNLSSDEKEMIEKHYLNDNSDFSKNKFQKLLFNINVEEIENEEKPIIKLIESKKRIRRRFADENQTGLRNVEFKMNIEIYDSNTKSAVNLIFYIKKNIKVYFFKKENEKFNPKENIIYCEKISTIDELNKKLIESNEISILDSNVFKVKQLYLK